MNRRDPKTYQIIGAAMEVHKQLGHGFLEAVYHEALALEFENQAIPAIHEVAIPIYYKQKALSTTYRADFVCFENIIVEVKAIKKLTSVEEAQIINYLKASKYNKGLLLNFGTPSLEYKRFTTATRKSVQSV